jgi:hypothetical protein
MIEPSRLRGVYSTESVPANVPVIAERAHVNDKVTSLTPTLANKAAAAAVADGVNAIKPPFVAVAVIVPIVVAPIATVITPDVNAEGAVVSYNLISEIIEPAGITTESAVVDCDPTPYVVIAPAAATPENVTCCDDIDAPVLSGAIVPSFDGLLRLKIRMGVENVDDMLVFLNLSGYPKLSLSRLSGSVDSQDGMILPSSTNAYFLVKSP